MALVFVHASGGVNYSAAALKTPVFYTLGTGDLVERGSGKPRAGMFVNRGKGAPMTLVIGVGGHDSQFSAEEYQIVTLLIEAIFKMRVPADADGAAGPIRLLDIVEGDSTWVGDLYSKEIAPYTAFKGNKALTAFLPNEQLAMMWKPNGPGLPMSIMIPTTSCGWCGTPRDEPKAGAPNPGPGPGAPSPDAGAASDAAPTMVSDLPDAGATRGGRADAAAPATPPDDEESDAGSGAKPPRGGGCSVGGRGGAGALAWLMVLGALLLARQRRDR
jgi:MYXO-CTERM domain-containing protein